MNNIILPLILIFTKFICILPRRWFKGNDSYMWRFLSMFLKRRRRIINANIDHCFINLTNSERSLLKTNIWNETYRALYENNFAWNASNEQVSKLNIEFIGLEILDKFQSSNKGVLVLFRHTLYLELSARILATKFGMYGLERPNNNALIQMIQMKGRTKSLKGIISNSDIKQCLKILKDGEIVMYGPDQDYRNKHSIISSFYGKRCLTTTVPAKLKKMSGCNVVYFDFFRVDDGFRAVIKDFNNASDSEKKFAENLNIEIENSISKAPEQYLWHHRRFKSQYPEIYE